MRLWLLLQHKMKKAAKAERWAQVTELFPTGAQRAIAQGPFPTTVRQSVSPSNSCCEKRPCCSGLQWYGLKYCRGKAMTLT